MRKRITPKPKVKVTRVRRAPIASVVIPVPPSIAPLLEAARAAHAHYRSAAGRIGTTGSRIEATRLDACGEAIRDALKARTEAHALDPQHSDPAWHADRVAMKGQTNEALVAFYVSYLARDVALAVI